MQTLSVGSQLPALKVRMSNSASGAKGSIHDDEKAREMGYVRGFVPGTTVLGCMARLLHEQFGERWLEDLRFSGRLRRPVYDDVEVTIESTVVEATGGQVTLALRLLDHEGEVAALASATLRTARDA